MMYFYNTIGNSTFNSDKILFARKVLMIIEFMYFFKLNIFLHNNNYYNVHYKTS